MARKAKPASGNEATVADLTEEIQTLRDDLGSLTDTISELTKSKGNEVSHIAGRQVDAAQKKAAEAADFVNTRASDAQHQAENFVKEQPATALGIAAGLGFLVGMVGTRR
jgi:ElaB/YqjD/DUF883 family membrane-anchored ribosome-binding protein